MPLRFDAEWGAELEKNRSLATAANRRFSILSFLAIFFLLAGSFWYLDQTSISDGKFVSLIVALSTLILVWIINSAVSAVQVTLVLLIATTEWVGRKQLGEYSAPDAGVVRGRR